MAKSLKKMTPRQHEIATEILKSCEYYRNLVARHNKNPKLKFVWLEDRENEQVVFYIKGEYTKDLINLLMDESE
jgi:hypothetical protein